MPFKTKEAKAAYDRRRYEEKRGALLAQKRAYYESRRKEIIAAVRARTDSDAKAEYDRSYRQRDAVRGRRAQQRREWQLANPEKAKAHNRKRSLTRRRARPEQEGLAYMAVLEGDPCSYCGGFSDQVDHIVPLKLGGDSAWSNLTAACAPCNYAKRAMPLLAFLGLAAQ